MLNKSFFLIICVCLISFSGISQLVPIYKNKAPKIDGKTLQIVYTGDELIDEILEEWVPKEITNFPYKFISKEKYESSYANKEVIFALMRGNGRFKLSISTDVSLELKDTDFLGCAIKYLKNGSYQGHFTLQGYSIEPFSGTDTEKKINTILLLRSINNDAIDANTIKERKKAAAGLPLCLLDSKHDVSEEDMQLKCYVELNYLNEDELLEKVMDRDEIIYGYMVSHGPRSLVSKFETRYFSFINLKTGLFVTYNRGQAFIDKDPEKNLKNKNEIDKKLVKLYCKEME